MSNLVEITIKVDERELQSLLNKTIPKTQTPPLPTPPHTPTTPPPPPPPSAINKKENLVCPSSHYLNQVEEATPTAPEFDIVIARLMKLKHNGHITDKDIHECCMESNISNIKLLDDHPEIIPRFLKNLEKYHA